MIREPKPNLVIFVSRKAFENFKKTLIHSPSSDVVHMDLQNTRGLFKATIEGQSFILAGVGHPSSAWWNRKTKRYQNKDGIALSSKEKLESFVSQLNHL